MSLGYKDKVTKQQWKRRHTGRLVVLVYKSNLEVNRSVIKMHFHCIRKNVDVASSLQVSN